MNKKKTFWKKLGFQAIFKKKKSNVEQIFTNNLSAKEMIDLKQLKTWRHETRNTGTFIIMN